MDYGALSLLPPIVAIILAILTKEVVLSLFGGVLAWQLVKSDWSPFDAVYGSIESIVSLFAQGWVVKSIVFIVLVGSILAIIVESGGVGAFVEYLTKRSNKVKSKRAALMLGYIIGIIIFIESTITSLVVGAVTAPLSEKFGASRAKVAYICDSTSAPVCSLIPLNGWGALIVGLVSAQIAAGIISGNAVEITINSIGYNLYAIVTLLFVLFIILSGKDFGAMRTSEKKASAITENFVEHSHNEARISFMMLPIAVLTFSAILFLYISGQGSIFKGSGTTAVFYGVLFTLAFCFVYFVLWHKRFKTAEYFEHFKSGAASMAYVGVMMILAFAIGEATKDMKTGEYLASFAKHSLNPAVLPCMMFLSGCIISFSTGTSWGTFSIMVPISIQMGASNGIDPALMVGAAVAGGVFGDHCSPISDTTIVSAGAAGCDLMEHIRTQIPYAIVCAIISAVGYLFIGFVV